MGRSVCQLKRRGFLNNGWKFNYNDGCRDGHHMGRLGREYCSCCEKSKRKQSIRIKKQEASASCFFIFSLVLNDHFFPTFLTEDMGQTTTHFCRYLYTFHNASEEGISQKFQEVHNRNFLLRQ